MTNRYNPYKIKPHGGQLISSHYRSLPKAVEAARDLVKNHGYESVDVVVRGSDIPLAKVDRRGLHNLRREGMDQVEKNYEFLTPEYLQAAKMDDSRTGADAGYYLDSKRGGPSLRQYHERLFDAAQKLTKKSLAARRRHER